MENTTDSTTDSISYRFTLFVSGMSVNSVNAIENLKKIGEKYLADDFDLQIIDITRDPGKAAEYQIIGVPTLIKTSPEPRRIILGDLKDTQKVLRILNIDTAREG